MLQTYREGRSVSACWAARGSGSGEGGAAQGRGSGAAAGERGLLDLERGRERLDDAHVRGDLVPDRDLDDVAGDEVSRVDWLQCAGAQDLRDTGPPPSAPDYAVHGGAAEEWVGCAKLHLGLIGVEGGKSIDGSLCR